LVHPLTNCPISEFDVGLRSRAPIYIPYQQAVPNTPVIDREHCIYFLTGKCRICETFCQAGAIDFDQEDEIIEVEVGAVILLGLRNSIPLHYLIMATGV